MTDTTNENRWVQYYQAIQGRTPRPLFVAALAAFVSDGVDLTGTQAIDLGCGDGTETLALLAQGWRVLAIDQQPEAIARVLAATPPAARAQLQTQVAAFEDATLPSADFVYAGLSLPFCAPDALPMVWNKIVSALPPGGRFAGHFFGERDSWRDNPAMTFHTAVDVQRLFDAFTIETWTEIENDRPTALDEPKHWHIYEVIARRNERLIG